MQLKIIVSAQPTQNGSFIPKFSFAESVGSTEEFTSYVLPAEAACSTEQEAIAHAEVHGKRQAFETYGCDVEIFIQKEE